MFNQKTFNGIEEHFFWTNENDPNKQTWYEFDYDAARKTALNKRREFVKEMNAKGYGCKVGSNGPQLRRKGGIGTGLPDIEFLSPSFSVTFWKEKE